MPLQQDFAAGNQFSFVSPIYIGVDDVSQRSNYTVQSERINGKYSYFGARDELAEEKDVQGFDVASLQLWKNAKLPGKQKNPMVNNYELARHHKEMMDMLQHLPDSDYELSLRDIVEVQKVDKSKQKTPEREVRLEKQTKKEQKKMKNQKNRLVRSKSMDSGRFLLKMFVPINLVGRKSPGAPSPSSKVSPRPTVAGGEKGGIERVTDDENCKTNEACHNSSNRRKKEGCYYFLYSKSKAR